jgi:predicted RNA-binding protein with PUA-like domain
MNYWLIKSEPNTYSIDDLQKYKDDYWDGIRNYGARNNMRAMKIGDLVLFYHSNIGKDVVGIAKVSKEAYPDPTAKPEDKDRWSVVNFTYIKHVDTPVTLAQVKANKKLAKMQLVVNSRLSVQPVLKIEFNEILKMAKTSL